MGWLEFAWRPHFSISRGEHHQSFQYEDQGKEDPGCDSVDAGGFDSVPISSFIDGTAGDNHDVERHNDGISHQEKIVRPDQISYLGVTACKGQVKQENT